MGFTFISILFFYAARLSYKDKDGNMFVISAVLIGVLALCVDVFVVWHLLKF